MSSDGDAQFAIRVRNVSKRYAIFERPEDRFKQMVVPRLKRMLGQQPSRYFRDFLALRDVSLDVKRGETVGIIGRNGSGKSTLLQVVCGTLQPTSGSVEVNGRVAALLELGAGFNPEFTGRENAFLNAAILGISQREIENRFDDIARFADIGAFIDQPVKTYSSGMYVRLAFATAINVDPDILVVDEALAVGDEAFQRKCFARIEDIKDKGGTILFVSHGAQTIVQLCDRAVLMDAGEAILDGSPKLVISHYQRLVNASSEAAPQIRETIRALSGNNEPEANIHVGIESADAEDSMHHRREDVVPAATTHQSESAADYWDCTLISQSLVSLEERGATIRDVRVTTLNGHPVNVLRMGKRYQFDYRVDFTSDARELGFGMFVRTVDGLGLAGIQTINSRQSRLPRVRAGQSVHVTAEFTCITLPGTYFFNCGVFGTVDDEQIVMHRLIDAVMWRTAPETDLLATGRVDFGATLRVLPI